MTKSLALCTVLLAVAGSAPAVKLKPETIRAFDRYVRAAEGRMDERLRTPTPLWVDGSPERLNAVRAGEVAVAPLAGQGDLEVSDGLIHDWVGALFVPGVTLAQTLASVQDYGRNKDTHKPEVIDSKLLARDGNDFRIYLRVMKKKVLTVVLNTEHDVRYFPVNATFCHSRSYSTRIAEVDGAGKPDERELPVGDDHGFLWRLYSYWRFQERDGGVYVECEAISLSRDIPTGLGWLIEPIIRTLPRESLRNTLASTRKAIQAKP
jgi:hypothetical protein